MKIKLHKPKQTVWTLALILFAAGLAAIYIPGLALLSYPLVVLSAALLLLGTSLF
jgi:hypothetical protein